MSESARVVLHKNGELVVYTGSSPHGQGHETVYAQLASEELGISFQKIRVVWGDTDLIPKGVGTFGSRSISTGGSAVVDASRKLKKELMKRASRILSVRIDSIEARNGAVVTSASQTPVSLNFQEILGRTGEDEISAESNYALRGMSYSSGVHLCSVTLDVETGKVEIVKYSVAEDCGRIVNKAVVEGQIEGGVVHGVGGALLESLGYDDEGNLLTTTFMDYSIPTSQDSPDIEIFHRVTPSKITLNGAKGVGESGTIGSYAAVINAVNDAISQTLGEAKASVNVAPALPNYIYDALRSR
jgi:aerobic carbon-monoxide dehydrogenase large subunit